MSAAVAYCIGVVLGALAGASVTASVLNVRIRALESCADGMRRRLAEVDGEHPA